MFTLRDVRLAFGDRVLFGGAEGTIGPRDRLGLVGPNGSGKSTLLRIISGQMEPDRGTLDRAGYVTVGYLPQEEVIVRGKTVREEAESAFEDVVAVQARLEAAGRRMAELPAGTPEYDEALTLFGELEHRLQDLDAGRLRARAESVLAGMGFAPTDLERDCGEFSGGWQMRIALTRLLLRQPALLLLDEPTNHLDLPSQRWLERFLCGYDGALVVVSHDRAFLDLVCTRTWALQGGRVDDYAGNYTFFVQESIARLEQRSQAAKNQQREIDRQTVFIERFRYKASKARQVQSRIKALERMDRVEVEEIDDSTMDFRFPDPPRSGQVVAELEELSKNYGELAVLRGVDLRLERGEKVAVVGPNGAGKSTLVRVLAGVEAFDGGERRLGHNVHPAWFAQHQSRELDPKLTVLETVEAAAGASSTVRLRSLLGAFLFSDDDVFKSVSVLSGGEKNRLALARMLVRPANLLILDEPTNHLDMRAKGVLQEALADYAGSVVVVSHDRDFVDGFIQRVIEVTAGRVRSFPGTVAEYIERLDREEEEARLAAAGSGSGNASAAQRASASIDARERRRLAAERRRELAPLRARVAELEKEIETGETRLRETEAAMTDPAFFQRGEKTRVELQAYEELKLSLQAAYEAWTAASEELAARDGGDHE